MGEREPAVLGDEPGGSDTAEAEAAASTSETAPNEAKAGEEAPKPSPGPETEQPDTPDTGPLEPPGGKKIARPPAGPATGARATAPRSAPTYYVAGFWRRLGAAAVDLGIVVPVALVLAWIAGQVAGVHLPPSRHRGVDFWLDLLLASDPALVGALGLVLAIATVYVLVFQITISRTPGMKLLRTRIIDVYGDPPSTGRAVARTAGYLAGVATLGLGFLWVGFDSEKRGLHDWISGTYVVKA